MIYYSSLTFKKNIYKLLIKYECNLSYTIFVVFKTLHSIASITKKEINYY